MGVADKDDGRSYWCVGDQARLLGSYDGVDAWTLFAEAVGDDDHQTVVSIHERLHHELQHSTPWGLLAMFSRRLADLGTDKARLRRLSGFCRDEARIVHETYATSHSIGDHLEGAVLLRDSPEYAVFYANGRRLAGNLDWDRGRFFADALLRACMCAEALNSLAVKRISGILISDLHAPDASPDRRLKRLLELGLPPVPPTGLDTSSTPDELGLYFDEVSDQLRRNGVPTLVTSEVRRLIDCLFEDVADLNPDLGRRLELDTVRSAIEDDVDEQARERLVLHDDGPLPVEIVPMQDLASRTGDFVRTDDRFGVHVALVWARSDLLARQFGRPNDLEAGSDLVLALQAAGVTATGRPVVRLGVFETENPDEVAEPFQLPFVFITTAASLLDAPGSASSDSIPTIYALVDIPVVNHVLRSIELGGRITWTYVRIGGGRRVFVFAYTVSVLPGIVWLLFTSQAGRSYVVRWFESFEAESVHHDAAAFIDRLVEIDVVVQHVVAAWWVFDQRGGHTSE